MKALFRLMDGNGVVRLNKHWQEKLRDPRQHGDGRSFKYLRDAEYLIELGPDKYEVTDLAKINLLKEIVKTRKRDGKLRLVIFDIPERLKANRNFFRRHLVDMEFQMRQQSVWVSPYPCEDLVALAVKYHGLQKYVELIVGKVGTIS